MPGMLLNLTLGLLLVLVLRRPARRWFGAGPAFTLWLLPPWLALLACLPTLPSTWLIAPTLPVFPAASAIVTQAGTSASAWPWLPGLWLAGAVIGLLRLALHYHRLLRQSHALPAAMLDALQGELGALDPRRLRLHPAGPAVLWALRSQLLLPADFLERFDADQRRLVLLHERTHLRRSDALWTLLLELTISLLWFHPLVWLASSRFRLDQELACDECVLRHVPHDEARYAHTLLHSAGMNLQPALTPWLTEPQLKERLHMIQHTRHGHLRRRIGFVGLVSLMLGGAWMVQAATPRASNAMTSPAIVHDTHIQPRYPADAVENKQQGTVILIVQIGADGMPLKAEVDPATRAAPSLIKAARESAMQWHFNPKIEDGEAVESSVRVPVVFKLNDDQPASEVKN